MGFSIATTARALKKEVQGQARLLEKASIRGLNKAVVQGRNKASREIRLISTLPAKTVKDKIRIIKADRRKKVAKLQTSYKAIPVIAYKNAKWLRKRGGGVSVKMRKDKSRKLFKGGFIARVAVATAAGPGFHKGAFIRKSRSAYPIKELKGPSIYSLFGEKLIKIQRFAADDLERLVRQQIEYEMSK